MNDGGHCSARYSSCSKSSPSETLFHKRALQQGNKLKQIVIYNRGLLGST